MSRPATGVTPQRTKDAGEAWLLLAVDGAAILETDGDWSDEGLLASARSVLGPSLRATRRPIKVRRGPPGSGSHLDWETRSVLNDSTRRQGLHVDGYGRYGAAYPDYVFLACERPAQAGGESFVVDCVKLVDDLRSGPAGQELTDFLWRQPVIQCSPEGVVWQAPAARLISGGRRTVLYNDKQHLTDPTPDQERLLAAWRERAEQAQDAAPRFLLRTGDLLCLDNYRVAHGRDRYEGGDRLLHRLWTWTDAAFGVPDPDAVDAEGAARDQQAQETLSVPGSGDRSRLPLWAPRPATTTSRRGKRRGRRGTGAPTSPAAPPCGRIRQSWRGTASSAKTARPRQPSPPGGSPAAMTSRSGLNGFPARTATRMAVCSACRI